MGDVPGSFTLGVPGLPTGRTAEVVLHESCGGAAASDEAVTAVGLLNTGENVCLVAVVTPPADEAFSGNPAPKMTTAGGA